MVVNDRRLLAPKTLMIAYGYYRGTRVYVLATIPHVGIGVDVIVLRSSLICTVIGLHPAPLLS